MATIYLPLLWNKSSLNFRLRTPTERNTADDDEDTNFVLIATGNRVNTLTMTANENEELKMTMDCMPRKVHELEKQESYAARRSVTDETVQELFIQR